VRTTQPARRGTPTDRWLAADLGHHRAFLRAHLETDVGGNHLVKNLKALIGLGIAAGDHADTDRWTRALLRQLGRQVLADGGHVERAPTYHCQVLADLRDIADLLAPSGRPVPDELVDAIARMRGWLSAVLGPLGTVPLLNDGFPVPPAATRMLLAGPRPRVAARTDVHEDRRADGNGNGDRNETEHKKDGNEDAVADPNRSRGPGPAGTALSGCSRPVASPCCEPAGGAYSPTWARPAQMTSPRTPTPTPCRSCCGTTTRR
jgi:hypothetical protein